MSTANAEHYRWGGSQNDDCDGWHLVCTSKLSVIEERMPPATSEARHVHAKLRQFFYALAGELTLEVEHHDFVLHTGHGIEISPGQAHQAMNRSTGDVRMLVTSQPPSYGDRTPA